MKRKLWMIILVLLCILCFTGCGCEHEWIEADCDTPKTCSLCQETEGEPLGHTWSAATCTAPKTCGSCGITEGEALGHTWEAATCDLPEKCAVCHATQGEALGHTWEEATTEAPKTCTVCQATEGSKLDTDARFTTAATKELQGVWAGDVMISGDMMGTTGYIDELPCTIYYTFGNTGDMTLSVEISDYTAFTEAMKQMVIDVSYAMLEEEGISKEDADEAMLAVYGMTTEEYANATVEEMDMDEMFSQFNAQMVYYVADGMIYISDSWSGEFSPSEYTLENGTLIIEGNTLDGSGEPIPLTKTE